MAKGMAVHLKDTEVVGISSSIQVVVPSNMVVVVAAISSNMVEVVFPSNMRVAGINSSSMVEVLHSSTVEQVVDFRNNNMEVVGMERLVVGIHSKVHQGRLASEEDLRVVAVGTAGSSSLGKAGTPLGSSE